MRKQTLFNILLISTMIVAVTAFIAVIYFFQQSANETALLNEKERMETNARQTSERITTKLKLGEQQLNLLAEADEIRFGNSDDCNQRITRLAAFISEEFDFFTRSNLNGEVDCASQEGMTGETIPELDIGEGQIFNINSQETAYKVLELPQNKSSLGIITPLYNETGELSGTLSTGLYLPEIGEEFKVRSQQGSTEFLLVDASGRILYSPQAEAIQNNYKESDIAQENKTLLAAILQRTREQNTDTMELNQTVASYSLDELNADFEFVAVLFQAKSDMINVAYAESGFLSGPEAVLGSSMVMLVFGVGTLLLIILYSNRIFFRPIKDISRAIKKASQGDFSAELNAERYSENDEFYALSKGFNKMTQSIKESKERLEKLVSERTQDLEKAKSELEIAKSNLEEKVEELERLNNLMIGREMRMIELKDEIEQLKKQDTNVDS